jgi:O-antigen/teichoic acid export membrane protein
MVGWNVLSQILNAVNWQVGRLVLPRFVDAISFGRYAMASDLSGIPYQTLVQPLGFPLNVAFVKANESGNLKSTYLKASGAVLILLLPIYSVLAILSVPLIDTFLGCKWEGAAILLAWLSIACIIEAPSTPMAALAVSLNESRRLTLRSLVQCLVLVPLTIFGASHFGVLGAVGATCAAAFIITGMTMMTVRHLTSATLLEQFAALSGPLLAGIVPALALAGVAHFITQDPRLPFMLVQIVVAGLLYLCLYVASIYAVSRWMKSAAGAEQMVISMGIGLLTKVGRTAFGRN